MAINFNYNYPQLAREAGFKLRQFKDGPLDWRLMGSFEIERILRDQNFEQIDGVLSHLSEAPLGSILETNILESGIAKYFIVSQFAVQYLLFCRKFLDETVQELRESSKESQSEVARLRKETGEANKQILLLNRRITQMEAIHEVIYPCALCNKNFISNDALNIHIERKHPQGSSSAHRALLRRGSGDSSPHVNANMYNLTLINTIKMELEIKQLKERLNVAEQEIRERAVVPLQPIVAAVSSTLPAPPKRALKDVGIQTNLCQEKDKIDCDTNGENNHEGNGNDADESKTQLDWLQDQVEQLEQWKQRQKTHSEASLAEINRKLNELTLALEETRGERDSGTLIQRAVDYQRNASPSVEDLDRLEQKLTEVSTSIADKLEEVVHQLEASYNKKLKEMEHMLEQRMTEVGKGHDQIFPRHRNENAGNNLNGITTSTPVEDNSRTLANKTYDIEDINAAEEQQQKPTAVEVMMMVKERRNDDELSLHSNVSNRTYVKTKKKLVGKYDITRTPSVTSTQTHDLTEASDSLSENSNSDEEKTDAVGVELKPLPRTVTTAQKELHTTIGNINLQRDNPVKISGASAQSAAKQTRIFTQRDAKKLANRQLASLGCDPKAKTLSFSAMRRISYNVTDNRNHLKQKYPKFYVTRNRIKNLVDKLCSAKLPESAELMLQTTQVLQPPAAAPRNTIQQSGTTSSAEEGEKETDGAAAVLSASRLNENDSFKQRLESILGTPLRIPQVDELHSTTDKPQPAPRKRVMFNTFRRASTDDDSDHKKQQPRSELSPFAPYD